MKTIRQTDKLFSSCCILYSLFIISPTKLFFHYRFQQKHMLLVSVIKYSSSYVFYQFTNEETFIIGNRKLELRPSHETHFKANIYICEQHLFQCISWPKFRTKAYWIVSYNYTYVTLSGLNILTVACISSGSYFCRRRLLWLVCLLRISMTSIEYFSLFTKGRDFFAVALKTWVTWSLHKSFEMYAVSSVPFHNL